MIGNATYATQPTTTMATTTTTDNTTYSQKIRDAFQLLTENNYVVYQEPKWKGQGKCDWCQYEHVLQEYMDFNDETGLYDDATDLCEGCVQDRNKFVKQQHEEVCAELNTLKEEKQDANFAMVDDYIFGRLKDICREENLPHPEFCPAEITNELASAIKLKEEIKNLKEENEMLKQLFKDGLADTAKKTEETINFDDATYTCFWAATNGDVVFWKVPCELYDIPDPQDEEQSRVQTAFMNELFGDEWGTLSSYSIRTLDHKTLAEIDGEGDE